jgi:hypothetical protein
MTTTPRRPELGTEQKRAEPALCARWIGPTAPPTKVPTGCGRTCEPPNEHLQHYYLKQGFTSVRTVVLPHNPSGALFQRPSQRIPAPCLQEVESLTG